MLPDAVRLRVRLMPRYVVKRNPWVADAFDATLERLTGLAGPGVLSSSASVDEADSGPAPSKGKRARKTSKRASKRSTHRPMCDE